MILNKLFFYLISPRYFPYAPDYYHSNISSTIFKKIIPKKTNVPLLLHFTLQPKTSKRFILGRSSPGPMPESKTFNHWFWNETSAGQATQHPSFQAGHQGEV